MQTESLEISKLLMSHFNGDKLNTGTLGNLVPQLHMHHIVRFENDATWPKPVWGNAQAKHYTTAELNKLIAILKEKIIALFPEFQAC